MSGEAIAIVGAAVALLGVLVPLLLSIRGSVAEVRTDLRALTARVDAVAERVARIEGAMSGPWRPQPANGNPAVVPPVAPSPEATPSQPAWCPCPGASPATR